MISVIIFLEKLIYFLEANSLKEYLESKEEVLRSVGSSPEGLTSDEAQKRISSDGPNKLREGKQKNIVLMFLKELTDPMLIILMVAAVLSVVTSAIQGAVEFADAIIIMVVVLINAILGVYQESKAEKAIEALQKMSQAKSKVKRDGKIIQVPSEELVKGDVIILEAGDAVPADGRLLFTASMKCEEAALTGESVPSDKSSETLTAGSNGDVSLGDRANMTYSGTVVVYGRGEAVITATAMNTEMGKIAQALENAMENETPLQKKLAQLSKFLTWAVLGISAIILVVNSIRMGISSSFSINGFIDIFMIAISLAVAAIPEGLATVVTIVLSIGVTKMSKKNAIIRKLTAVETLGCTQTICSDKTGTLTQNKMTVIDSYSVDENKLATAMALCSDAYLNDTFQAEGEPTEAALVNYAYKLGINKTDLEKTSQERVSEAPFDSSRKMMSTIHKNGGAYIQYTKGAPDEILKCCTHILTADGVKVLEEKDRTEILKKNKSFADRALRVLAASYKELDSIPENIAPASIEKDLIFIGLVGMIDPVRPEVVDAIKECLSAGIRPVMITGDHRDTAIAIGKDLGIITNDKEAITGAELDELSDEELAKNIDKYHIYARVQPEHKVRIVKAWQKKGFITAMTGDGVNDAPAIKNADIGVGMGITGTDVTKNVADMVLADDNFATIVAAVEEGRRIYDNIKKAIQFLLSSNLAEVIAVFAASMMGFELLSPAMLLWINLITDSFPAVGLGMEKAERDIMQRPPRSADEGVFADGLGLNTGIQGFFLALITIVSYIVGEIFEVGHFSMVTSQDGMTMAFLTLSLAEMFHSFNMRSMKKSIFSVKGHNNVLNWSLLGAFVLTVAVINIPFLRTSFGFAHISFTEFAIAILLAITIIPFVELSKLIQRKMDKKQK